MITQNVKAIFHKILRRIGYALTRFYILINKGRMSLNKKKPNKPLVIVSMTTYSARFATVHRTLESVLVQFRKPDKVIVWLDDDVKLDDLPKTMREFLKYGVEFIPIEGRYKPHKKYLHAMEAFPNDVIITVDDDLLYPPTLIGNLLKTHERYPECVCARRVHRMLTENEKLLSYSLWEGECRSVKEPRNDIFATGVGGVLYPPHCMGEDAFNREQILSLCLMADDIWLKCMELLNGTKVVWSPCIVEIPEALEKEQTSNLQSSNVTQGYNDIYLAQVMDFYKIEVADFFE